MTFIRVDSVHKYFDNGLVKALNGISLDISKGEICAVTGPSGCGKSTLLNLIGALDVPTHGCIHVKGEPLINPGRHAGYRNRQVGFVFQFHNLLGHLTLAENVALPALAVPKMLRSGARKKAVDLLCEVGLEERADFLPTQVSGGERQRAAVARALVNAPEILLADEPTGSVDTKTAGFIMSAIVDRCRRDHMTVLLVTHDMNIAARADRIVKMQDGLLAG